MSNSSSNHFTCPSGGTWYVCPDAPYFVGCCSSDPCTNVDANSTAPCPDLYPASFDGSIFDKLLPNLCIGSANTNWYTCNSTHPPFLGCCSSRACDQTGGCPADDLLAAAWSSSRQGQFTLFQDEGTGDDNDKGSGGGGGLSGGAIAGIVVGAIAALVIVGALLWLFMRRRNKKAAAMSGHGRTPSVVEGEQQRMYPGEYGYQHPSPMSPYHDSQYSSPSGTTTGAGKNPKYMSTSSAGISLPSLSPGLPSETGRSIPELYSNTGSEDMLQQKWAPGQNYGLGVHGAQKSEPIQELDSNVAKVHELDGGNRT
ncbi:uncharacterized protein N7496_000800 [Penicillium cataractarum]|uniref:Uncharacterized protein n=1 Tax=Penicillium cataractarum TaxID=2100454 RepID=A0A9W9VUQ6_9EURO|nr:uncharacterized protein N7496_000800 [Penicillium cataractarum]KAJ5389732.1 hypothetical protein N7496_000800 [Penicillium cataractarum]